MPSSQNVESTRVVIVGAGAVGATAAYAITLRGLVSELVLVDVNKKKCQGEVLDLQQGLSFVPQIKVWAGSYRDCREADMVVIAAGARQELGQSRLDLAKINAKVVTDIVKKVVKQTKTAIILVVTNPVDVMTYVAQKTAKLPLNQVFGSGTTLDSARFRYLLAESLGLATDSVGAYLIGEHGDSSVPVFSHSNIMGESIKNLPRYNRRMAKSAYKKTRNAAYDIICRKGATFYSIGLAIAALVRAVLFDEKHVFPVSMLLKGDYGIKDVCLSLPGVIGRNGLERRVEISLEKGEKKLLKKSADIIKKTIKSLKS